MTANAHFQRLKHIYASNAPMNGGEHLAISYGHAELNGWMVKQAEGTSGAQHPYQRLLRDVASLAAGTLEKEHIIDAEQFTVNVHDSGYEGPVVVTADVVLAEPPRFVVHASLLDGRGEVLAEATGIFRPGAHALPPGPAPDQQAPASAPRPASFMPVFLTPVGLLCLN